MGGTRTLLKAQARAPSPGLSALPSSELPEQPMYPPSPLSTPHRGQGLIYVPLCPWQR